MIVKVLSPVEINLEEIEEPMSVTLRELGAIPEFEAEGVSTALLPHSYEIEVKYIAVTSDHIHFGKELTPEAIQKIVEYEHIAHYRLFHKEELMSIKDALSVFGVKRTTIGLQEMGFDEVTLESLPRTGTIVIAAYEVAG